MKFLFVYNKKAGKKFELSTERSITELMPKSTSFSFVDIRELETSNISIYDILVAVGGDGTVNTVAKLALENDKILGVIPKGSGDGLARFLGISRDVEKAVESLLYGKIISIDTATVDDIFFVNVAGAGFEAEVAHKFGAEGVRGLFGYARTILKSFGDREEQAVTLTLDGKKETVLFFSLSIANGAQWGNNFEIASEANIQDGLLDIAIMRKPKWYEIVGLLTFLRSKKQENNRLFTYYKAEKIDLKKSGKLWHVDGEPVILKNKKHVKVYPNSLKMSVPQ